MNRFMSSDLLAQVNLPLRLKAACIHFLLSLLIALGAAALVFGLWYPWPYRVISGGQQLFYLVVAVDVVLGPALTFAVFNLKKGWPHLRRDLVVIAALQIAALVYGLHTVYVARPVVVAFEVDRFKVVSYNDVLHSELESALPEFRTLSLTGPKLVGTRTTAAGEDKLKSIELSLQGYDIGARPSYWQAYEKSAPDILKRSRPVTSLLERYPDRATDLQNAITETGKQGSELRFLPVMGRADNWVVLLDASNAQPLGFAEADGFF
jgi:hypothetical protein